MIRRSLFAVTAAFMTVGAFSGTVASLDGGGGAPPYYALA
jgi:hypothetical protein